MKIAKTYCDICGKEIKDSSYTLSQVFNRLGYTTSFTLDFQDVCEKCAEKIHNFAKGMIIR